MPRISNKPSHFCAGFTFIEVMIAMLIFTLAVLAATNIADGSVKATREARDISRATWLLQGVMAELETKLESQGIDKACDKKKEGKFEGDNQGYTWKTECYEIDIKLSETASKSAKEEENESGASQENIIQKMVLNLASEYITKSLREIHAEVYWTQGKNKRMVSATTHFVRYDQQPTVPDLSALTGGAGGGGK